MQRVAIIADSHFDQHSRFAECVRVHNWIADDIADRGVDLVLHSGDVYERKSTIAERAAVAEWCRKVTEHAPLVIVRGNHDAPGDLQLLERLETVNPLVVEEGAGVHTFGGCIVGCMAWPTKASVLALGALSHAEGELVAGEALRNVLRGLGATMAADLVELRGFPRILLAHAMVRGSITSTGQPLVGCDFELGLDDLALAGANLYALGHIHKGQEWGPTDMVIYPGSPRRTAFGETEEKGYVIADFGDDGQLVSWERIATPCTQMVLLETEWSDDGFDPGSCDLVSAEQSGAEVRFRYHVAADQREAARGGAEAISNELLELGAAVVKIEEVVRPVGSARAPEVAEAKTLGEKLYALWKARGNTPEADRAERLIGKTNQLEENARAI